MELRHGQIEIILPYDLLAYIESREGKIEFKVKSGFITRVLDLKYGKLFCITYSELNLKTGAVEPDDLFRIISVSVRG
ncbi:MAG: hypothetical protein K2M56_10695 [Muribaculaceae bacterium]|nr:hypothetical protein [Muribaculaceae bacterium]